MSGAFSWWQKRVTAHDHKSLKRQNICSHLVFSVTATGCSWHFKCKENWFTKQPITFLQLDKGERLRLVYNKTCAQSTGLNDSEISSYIRQRVYQTVILSRCSQLTLHHCAQEIRWSFYWSGGFFSLSLFMNKSMESITDRNDKSHHSKSLGSELFWNVSFWTQCQSWRDDIKGGSHGTEQNVSLVLKKDAANQTDVLRRELGVFQIAASSVIFHQLACCHISHLVLNQYHDFLLVACDM